jgi:hypothetical protein
MINGFGVVATWTNVWGNSKTLHVVGFGKIELPYPLNAPTFWWNGKCFQWNDTSQMMENHLYFQDFIMWSVFRSNLIIITLNKLWISTLTNIKSICVAISLCISAFGIIIGSPLHSVHELFPYCCNRNIGFTTKCVVQRSMRPKVCVGVKHTLTNGGECKGWSPMTPKCTPTLEVALVRELWMFRTLVGKLNKHQIGPPRYH